MVEAKTEFSWPPLESDPEIFNNYLWKLGLPNSFHLGEIFSLDEELIPTVPKSVGIIANIQKGKNEFTYSEEKKLKYSDVDFFMKQAGTLDNACGVIAALHVIGNNISACHLQKDSILEKFFTASVGKDENERCALLEGMNDFKSEHQVYSNQGQSKLCEKQEDVCGHFIAFVLHKNRLFELNGSLGNPYLIDENVQPDDFIKRTFAVIQDRLSNGYISDNLAMMYFAETN